MSALLVNQTSGDTEWYTDPRILASARDVLGAIDLDPASSPIANENVKAARYFTRADDGLSRPWKGRVWMNHPFGIAEKACDPAVTGRACTKGICAKRGWHQRKDYGGNAGWVRKLVDAHVSGDVTAAICICFASMSEAWFRPLLAYPQCFPHGRVNYFAPEGKRVEGVTKGSVITYLGPDIAAFARDFAWLGTVKVKEAGDRVGEP